MNYGCGPCFFYIACRQKPDRLGELHGPHVYCLAKGSGRNEHAFGPKAALERRGRRPRFDALCT